MLLLKMIGQDDYSPHPTKKKKKGITISQMLFISDYIKQLAPSITSASLTKTVQINYHNR